MRLKIFARQSDLARIQAFQVGETIEAKYPHIKVEYTFRKSLGDINLEDPLWKMPERGVFTQDFYQDLVDSSCDLVVHSWKDLPIEERQDTVIVGTLPRADMRDLLLVRKDKWPSVQKTGMLRVLSSSPRREYNLTPFLTQYMPVAINSVEFRSVRGNMLTRVQKLLQQDVDALVLAKAAIDRLLSAPQLEFAPMQSELQSYLKQCLWMVLPVTVNPPAAAQGALAIEVNRQRQDIIDLVQSISCLKTKNAVERERAILASYGGGCHQKIGAGVISKWFGEVTVLKGLSSKGQVLDRTDLHLEQSLQPPLISQKTTLKQIFPDSVDQFDSSFERRDLKLTDEQRAKIAKSGLLVSKATAWTEEVALQAPSPVVWAAGLKTWYKLAKKGVWVNGSFESLGESTLPEVEYLAGDKLSWIKLSHKEAPCEEDRELIPTYELKSVHKLSFDLKGKTYFYWTSGSAFLKALEDFPEIVHADHSCGPGNTYQMIKSRLGEQKKISIFLSYEAWKDFFVKQVAEKD